MLGYNKDWSINKKKICIVEFVKYISFVKLIKSIDGIEGRFVFKFDELEFDTFGLLFLTKCCADVGLNVDVTETEIIIS